MVVSLINPPDICYMAIDAYTKANKLPVMYPKSVIERQRMAEALQIPAGAQLPPLPPNHGPTRGEPGAFQKLESFRGYVRKHWGEEDWRRHRWAYCRLTERVDAEIGRILAAFRENGLDRNTVLVFSSDHGDMDSAHGFEHKSLPYEESARVPFIVSWPGQVPAGRINRKHLVSSSTDLLPTLCDYAGIQPPVGLPGRSVRSLVSGQDPANWREDVVIECNDSRSLRTRRYKYTVWDGDDPRETLFDMQKDPGEMNSLVNEKTMASVLADHRARLRRRIEERTDDYGRSLLVQKT
jgi:choline-sulfatase